MIKEREKDVLKMLMGVSLLQKVVSHTAAFSMFQVLFFVLVVLVFVGIVVPIIGMIKNWKHDRIQTLEPQEMIWVEDESRDAHISSDDSSALDEDPTA